MAVRQADRQPMQDFPWHNANTMPSALAKLHRKLDRAVARAYGDLLARWAGGVVSKGDRIAVVDLHLGLLKNL